MRKLIAIGTAVALLLPSLSFAAFNDVTLTTDTVLDIGGITVNVSGSSAVVESITVGASTFSFTLASGSSIEVTAPSRNRLLVDSETNGTITCTSAVSKISYTGTGAQTIVVTPSGSLCNTPVSGSGGSSGGGGGGGAVTTTTTTTATTTATTATTTVATTPVVTSTPTTPTVASLQAQLAGLLAQLQALKGGGMMNASVGASFKRDLEVGATGDDVKALQVYLNAHGYIVTSSGGGSPGNETTKFGGLTKAALIKLQKAAGISPAAGYFGPKTRAYVAAHP